MVKTKKIMAIVLIMIFIFSLGACDNVNRDRRSQGIIYIGPSPEGGRQQDINEEYSEDNGNNDDVSTETEDEDEDEDDSTSDNAQGDGMIPITGARVPKSVLIETKNVWYPSHIFADYEEFVEHIGWEASAYSQKSDFLTYAWYASDDKNAKLYVNYTLQDDGAWKLYSTMSYSLDG